MKIYSKETSFQYTFLQRERHLFVALHPPGILARFPKIHQGKRFQMWSTAKARERATTPISYSGKMLNAVHSAFNHKPHDQPM